MAAFVCVSMFLVNILSVDISMYESCKNFFGKHADGCLFTSATDDG
jgi:hypothetical protein